MPALSSAGARSASPSRLSVTAFAFRMRLGGRLQKPQQQRVPTLFGVQFLVCHQRGPMSFGELRKLGRRNPSREDVAALFRAVDEDKNDRAVAITVGAFAEEELGRGIAW